MKQIDPSNNQFNQFCISLMKRHTQPPFKDAQAHTQINRELPNKDLIYTRMGPRKITPAKSSANYVWRLQQRTPHKETNFFLDTVHS